MANRHPYESRICWTGNRGQGTVAYRGYDRTWEIRTPNKPVVRCSNDPLLGGDPTLPNPEDLLLSSLAACHMLWFLHLACRAGIVVQAYEDCPVAVGELYPDGSGRFTEVTLKPAIELVSGSSASTADRLHGQIHQYCFIARSMNFPVRHAATYTTGQ